LFGCSREPNEKTPLFVHMFGSYVRANTWPLFQADIRQELQGFNDTVGVG
jgi:uncharacterized protein YfaQ (DUF2300 family)